MKSTLIPHSRPWIAEEDLSALKEVLQGGMIAHGHLVHSFEQAVANELSVCGALACNSGTAALGLALKLLNIGGGDEVILPTYVCWSVLAAITATGAIPRFCDVNEQGVISVHTVIGQITTRTRAIVAVHIFGHPCDIVSLVNLGLPVIEDACQALGLVVGSVPAGALGTFGILSFHATKCMTTGEGGMLVSDDPALIKRARALVESAQQFNATSFAAMSDLQAALGMAQLTRYSSFLKRRHETFGAYHQAFCGLIDVKLGYCGEPAFLFRYTLRTQLGFEFAHSGLLKYGVQARRGVDELLHRRFGLDDRNFPCASNIFMKSFSIPFYPSLDRDDEIEVICAVKKVFCGS
jgi:UDP-4-amino-4-deoxy-L-arabinose-oxoglutarate aminotransferase